MPVPNLRHGSILFLFFLGAYLFCRGFFLHRNVSTRVSTCADLHDFHHVGHQPPPNGSARCWSEPRYRRAVVLVIDALKYDFTVTRLDDHSHARYWSNKMPIFEQLRLRHPQSTFHARFVADSPTTTLQRLTALLTGGMPTFIDAATNFYQTAIVEDNLVQQMWSNGKRVVFLGDDTWMSLLPGVFHRSYPYPSFVVHDLHTVDDGIISHIYDEMAKDDVDVLIAHFLGVDHCGHWYEQDHPEMANKLAQMNRVVANVSRQLRDGDLLVVLGDHGMTLSGDHGGDTEEETTAALFLYAAPSPNDHSIATAAGTSNRRTPQAPLVRSIELDEPRVSQIDLVPTLALLLGLPIPFSNLGQLIEPLFISRPPHGDELVPLWINLQQVQRYVNASGHLLKQISHTHKAHQLNRLWDVLTVNFNDSLSATSLHRAATKYLGQVKAVAQSAFTVFNVPFMGLGLVHLSLAAFIAVLASRRDAGGGGGRGSSSSPSSSASSSESFADSSSSEKSLYNWVVVVMAVVYSLGHFSNSFIVNEDRASLYLLQGLAAFVVAANRHSWPAIGTTVALMAIVRVLTPFGWVCRYEQGCQPAVAHEDLPDPLGTTLAVAVVVASTALAMWSLRSSFGAAAYGRSLGAQTVAVLLNVGTLCLLAYWFLHLQDDAKLKAMGNCKDMLPNVSALCFLALQVGLVLHRRYAADRVTLRLNYVLLHAIGLTLLLSVYTSPARVPSLAVVPTVLLLMYLSRAVPEELEGALAVALMSNAFFATGHQNTFQQIQWKSGFVGTSGGSLLVSGSRVLLDTFSGHIVVAFLLPSVVRRGLPKSSFVAILLTRLTSQCVACLVLRQHLMLWAVFATRLLFAMIEALVLILGVTVGRLVCRNSAYWTLSHMGVLGDSRYKPTSNGMPASVPTKPSQFSALPVPTRKKMGKSK